MMSGATTITTLLKKLSTWTTRASSSSSSQLPSSSSSSAEQELHNLENTMKKIHAVLEDAEEKGLSDESEQLRLQELKEVAYDAEDVLDEHEYEVMRMKLEARRQATASRMGNKHDEVMSDWNSYHPKVSISDELASRIKDIRRRLEEINDWNRIGLCLLEKGRKRRRMNKWRPSETASYLDEAKTLGREDEKNEIIKWLLQEEEGDAVSVMGIVGMGGLGKTTLAQMAYNDARVCQYFDLKGWVYVRENLNLTSLVKTIYDSFDRYTSVSGMSLDELHEALRVILDGKRFFLVLDDVWNLKVDLCSSLKAFLVDAGVGKILMTTRDEGFVKIMQTTPPIYLSHLSSDDSWLLFKKIACEGRSHDLLEIGKKVVRKCRGLPLAIKALAGILSVEDEEEVWNDVLESEIWELDELENDDIFPALRMSYDRLPLELRQCFMYLCLFPKGSLLEKPILVQQWMSHGFIASGGNKMEEDVGNDICNEFLNRSILQYFDTKMSKDLLIIHDLMHDLSQSVAKDEYLLITTLKSQPTIPKTIRHVSVDIMDKDEIINLEPLYEAKHLRTLLLSAHRAIPVTDWLPKLRYLRALDLSWWGSYAELTQGLPDSIGSLKHLRYLDVGYTESIPASVYNLHYLQTLKAENSMCEIRLSREVGDLINLRHLYGFDEDHLPREVAGLANLQTLHHFTVGVESGDMKRCRVGDLKRLPNLRGWLNVGGLETVTWSDVTPAEAYLKSKRGLNLLRLYWDDSADVDERLAAQVLDCLRPHRDLTEMSLIGYPGVVLPAWLGCELPALKSLVLEGMDKVRSFVLPFVVTKSEQCDGSEGLCSLNPAESRRWFPSLEEMTLRDMRELEEWQGIDGRDLPCLRKLTVIDCPKLRRLPSLPWLTELCLLECSFELVLGCRRLPMLRCLSMTLCTGASLIFPGDRTLDLLEELSIMSCSELTSVEGLGSLVSLRRLTVVNCPILQISPNEDSVNKRKNIVVSTPKVNHERNRWMKD